MTKRKCKCKRTHPVTEDLLTPSDSFVTLQRNPHFQMVCITLKVSAPCNTTPTITNPKKYKHTYLNLSCLSNCYQINITGWPMLTWAMCNGSKNTKNCVFLDACKPIRDKTSMLHANQPFLNLTSCLPDTRSAKETACRQACHVQRQMDVQRQQTE